MKRYTVYKNGEIINTGIPWPTADGSPPPDLEEDVFLLEEVVEADPTHDPTTHTVKKTGNVEYDLEKGTATQTKELVAIPPLPLLDQVREGMRQSFEMKPKFIRANYFYLYEIVNKFLDSGNFDLAMIVVQDVEPSKKIEKDTAAGGLLEQFTAAKDEFIAGIQSLIDNQ